MTHEIVLSIVPPINEVIIDIPVLVLVTKLIILIIVVCVVTPDVIRHIDIIAIVVVLIPIEVTLIVLI